MSPKERRYLQLRAFLKSSDIKDLEVNKEFVIIKKFKDCRGVLEREVKFIADFFYFDKVKNVFVIEAVKTNFSKTAIAYKIQRKLIKQLYPNYHFIETIC